MTGSGHKGKSPKKTVVGFSAAQSSKVDAVGWHKQRWHKQQRRLTGVIATLVRQGNDKATIGNQPRRLVAISHQRSLL
eukprot:jgi/Hompol1/5248/HPOL_000661-RA